ncbi:hypothetical protein G0U57_018884, partial [Chelydra serpentina]
LTVVSGLGSDLGLCLQQISGIWLKTDRIRESQAGKGLEAGAEVALAHQVAAPSRSEVSGEVGYQKEARAGECKRRGLLPHTEKAGQSASYLKCLYTNARSLGNKQGELEVL